MSQRSPGPPFVVIQLAAAMLSLLLAACAPATPEGPGVEHLSGSADAGQDYVRIATRPGVIQGFQLIRVKKPTASLVMFVGGPGNLGGQRRPGQRGAGRKRGSTANFLVRVQDDLAEEGFNVALVDVPSDRANLANFRASAAHAEDVRGVMDYMRGLAAVPVWLVGTSRGTISAANAAARVHPGADGLILTSSLLVAGRGADQESVFSVDLAQIRVPTLVVHNEDDQCPQTPPRALDGLVKQLHNAPKVEKRLVRGGDMPYTGPCDPGSYHGYLGIEDDVVQAMTAFIQANTPGAAEKG